MLDDEAEEEEEEEENKAGTKNHSRLLGKNRVILILFKLTLILQ